MDPARAGFGYASGRRCLADRAPGHAARRLRVGQHRGHQTPGGRRRGTGLRVASHGGGRTRERHAVRVAYAIAAFVTPTGDRGAPRPAARSVDPGFHAALHGKLSHTHGRPDPAVGRTTEHVVDAPEGFFLVLARERGRTLAAVVNLLRRPSGAMPDRTRSRSASARTTSAIRAAAIARRGPPAGETP